MVILRRGRGKSYFYRSIRTGKQIRHEYVGSGALAEFAAYEAAALKAQRQAITQGFRSLQASFVEPDRLTGEYKQLADWLTHSSLLAAGFYKPPGHKLWRRHRYGKRRRT